MRHPEVRNLRRHQTTKQLAFTKEKCLANCPAAKCGKELEFEASETRVFEVPCPSSSAVTSIARNCERRGPSIVFAGHTDRVPHLILPISRQKLLRTVATETPNR